MLRFLPTQLSSYFRIYARNAKTQSQSRERNGVLVFSLFALITIGAMTSRTNAKEGHGFLAFMTIWKMKEVDIANTRTQK